MGSSCAWHRDGFHVALTFTSGDIAVVVSGLQHLPECSNTGTAGPGLTMHAVGRCGAAGTRTESARSCCNLAARAPGHSV